MARPECQQPLTLCARPSFGSLSSNGIGGYYDDYDGKFIATPEGPKALAEAIKVNAVLSSLK